MDSIRDLIMEKIKLVKVEKFLGKFELVPALRYSAVGQAIGWFLHAIFVSVSCSSTGKFNLIFLAYVYLNLFSKVNQYGIGCGQFVQ